MSMFEKNSEPANQVDALEDAGKMYCPDHLVGMVCSTSSQSRRKAYYKCPVKGCKQRDSKARSKCRFPTSPQTCPRCSTGKKSVACVLDKFKQFKVAMKCPNDDCDFFVEIPRPDIELQRTRHQNMSTNPVPLPDGRMKK